MDTFTKEKELYDTAFSIAVRAKEETCTPDETMFSIINLILKSERELLDDLRGKS